MALVGIKNVVISTRIPVWSGDRRLPAPTARHAPWASAARPAKMNATAKANANARRRETGIKFAVSIMTRVPVSLGARSFRVTRARPVKVAPVSSLAIVISSLVCVRRRLQGPARPVHATTTAAMGPPAPRIPIVTPGARRGRTRTARAVATTMSIAKPMPRTARTPVRATLIAS